MSQVKTQIKLKEKPNIPQMGVFQGVGTNNCKHLYLRRENVVSGDVEYVCLRCGERFILKRRW